MSLRDVEAFLLGEAPLDGVWFGDPHPSGNRYWWRKHLRDALAEAARAEAEKAEPVADDEVLFVFDADMQGRHWWSGGTWLYPGDAVVVRRAAARGKG